MQTAKVLTTFLAIAVLTAASFAADVVGKWSGTMMVENEKGESAEMRVQGGSLPSLALELKADKTYTGTQTGGPGNQKHTTSGTWKLQGNTLSLTPVKRDGQAATGEGVKPRVYTLSKDGKSLTIDLTAQFKAGVKVNAEGKAPNFKARLVLHRTK